MTHFLWRDAGNKNKVDNALDVANSNRKLLNIYHMSLLAKYNIFFLPGKMGCFSEAHNPGDLKRLFSATGAMVESGILNE